MQDIMILTLRGNIEIALRRILRKKKKLKKYNISIHCSTLQYLFMFGFRGMV